MFYARITLEDKLGTAYEPYIFAALNSAKVMVVLGTKPEYFQAVWVKNEWSRHLKLVKSSGGKKVLIPAFKDMDPYDLPEEFSHLQAQDMSKLGFMQDLIRGIKKIIAADEPKGGKETVVVTSGAADTAPLLKRAFMFLEDGNWDSANEYCERVLDREPENARAYLGKLMAELRVRTQADLSRQSKPFENNSNYEKIMRFGDEALKAELKDDIKQIKDRNEIKRKNDALEKARQKIVVYDPAQQVDSDKAISSNREALSLVESIPGWKDADALAAECRMNIEKLEDAQERAEEAAAEEKRRAEEAAAAEERRRAEEERKREEEKRRKAEEARQKAEETKRKTKKVLKIVIPSVCAAIVLALVITKVIIPNSKLKNDYNSAVALMENGEYDEAYTAFTDLGDYKDSKDKALDAQYNAASALLNGGKFSEAYEAFTNLGDYKDSKDKAADAKVQIIKSPRVGDYVNYGSYEQDNNTANGKEPIEWRVLDVKDGKALLISKYALDAKAYEESGKPITWETCTLRQWLNSDFLNEAFSDKEQSAIETATVNVSANREYYSTDPGNDTQDKVFLLSLDEAKEYITKYDDRACVPTDYAIGKGAETTGGNCRWWLRTLSLHCQYAAFSVNYDGTFLDEYVNHGDVSVRPAIWIDTSKVVVEK